METIAADVIEQAGLRDGGGEVGGIGQGGELIADIRAEMIIPAVMGAGMPRPAPMPRNARPMVAVVVQEEPHAIPTIAAEDAANGQESASGSAGQGRRRSGKGSRPEAMKLETRKPTVQRIRTASMEAARRSIIPASISLKLWPQIAPTMQATTMDRTRGMCAS